MLDWLKTLLKTTGTVLRRLILIFFSFFSQLHLLYNSGALKKTKGTALQTKILSQLVQNILVEFSSFLAISVQNNLLLIQECHETPKLHA